MTGWQRIKLVLSVLYWAFALTAVYYSHKNSPDSGFGLELGIFIGLYAVAAAIWWAFAGFTRQR